MSRRGMRYGRRLLLSDSSVYCHDEPGRRIALVSLHIMSDLSYGLMPAGV